MKLTPTVLILVGVMIPISYNKAAPLPVITGDKAIQALRTAERVWLDAYSRLDSAAVRTSESGDFLLVSPALTVTKSQQLQAMEHRLTSIGSVAPKITYEISEQDIRFYGDIAVVSDVSTVTASSHPGIFSTGRFLQSEIWQNKSGTWKIVHLHISMGMHGM